MKKLYSLFLLSATLVLLSPSVDAQVNLPYTLNFTSESTAAWSGGTAKDGEGGTQKINGLDVRIFAATTGFSPLPGATMLWRNATWFASTGFSGITPGPDVAVTMNGIPAIVIKSASSSVDFSLAGITLYDWGGISPVISTYNNGVLKGTINVNLPVDGNSKTLTEGVELSPSLFNDIDEVRLYPQGGQPVFWIGLNGIYLKPSSATLPVRFINFSGWMENGQSQLQWQTTDEVNMKTFVVEKSRDGIAFDAIGTVAATGGKSGATYRFSDASVTGKMYYRIRQISKDDIAIYSAVVLVDIRAGAALVQLYPNPATSQLTIVNNKALITAVKIYTSAGTLVSNKAIGANTASVSVATLPKGLYQVAIVSAGETIYKQLVKE